MDLQEQLDFANRENRFMLRSGIRVTRLERDLAVVELDAGEDSQNLFGALHGGVYFTMADCAAGAAARTDGGKYVTLDADIHFLHGVRGGKVSATAEVRHRGRSTCVVGVSITDGQGRLLSDVSCTMFRTGDFDSKSTG